VPHTEVACSSAVDVQRVPGDQAPLVLAEGPTVEMWFLRGPDRLRDQIMADEIALVEEDAFTRNELRHPAEELGREWLGTIDRVRCRYEREHGLEV